MILNEIAAKLAALGLGTVGTSIFIGSLPATPDVCIAVYEFGGAPAEYGLGDAAIKHESPGLQVVVRGAPKDYAGPRARIETAYQGLAAVQAETLSAGGGGTSAFYHFIHPQQAPFVLRRDENERVLLAVNFLIEKEPSA